MRQYASHKLFASDPPLLTPSAQRGDTRSASRSVMSGTGVRGSGGGVQLPRVAGLSSRENWCSTSRPREDWCSLPRGAGLPAESGGPPPERGRSTSPGVLQRANTAPRGSGFDKTSVHTSSKHYNWRPRSISLLTADTLVWGSASLIGPWNFWVLPWFEANTSSIRKIRSRQCLS